MSSNIQDNAQNAAVAPGSDTDSVSSLSSHVADMHLGGSSSPAKQSSVASDEEGDITIIKDTSVAEEGEGEEGQVPFYDKFGAVSFPVKQVLMPFRLYTLTCKYTTFILYSLNCLFMFRLFLLCTFVLEFCALRLMYALVL